MGKQRSERQTYIGAGEESPVFNTPALWKQTFIDKENVYTAIPRDELILREDTSDSTVNLPTGRICE